MKKIVLIVLGLAVLALPPAAAAAVKPTKYEKLLARLECGMERGADPVKRAEFRAHYPGKRPLLVCIRFKSWELALERAAAPAEARIACRQEKLTNPEFGLEFPGGVKQCIRLESMP